MKNNSIMEIAIGAIILSLLKTYGQYAYLKGAKDGKREAMQEEREEQRFSERCPYRCM